MKGSDRMREYLVKLREARGVLSSDICRATGLKLPMYSLVEHGKRTATLKFLTKIADYYGINLSELILAEVRYRDSCGKMWGIEE